ncbi:hypothetical protein H310_10606 [Aphanomyces invadans]|uniref:Transmembrane protein 198 n=1 Tax=Aphanomyces invadans TaxID=157072 RepID=A0A024TQR3_9STRA|nr:hypothetical protein H310_10606 [Aphanomyces invadans]ETV95946.1 hypothetical protein H310_10606 [Aphanomyces invadans]|eukprot:XP_008875257.1 hypothetical protein H310_10606 [Aphanomyces invadans]
MSGTTTSWRTTALALLVLVPFVSGATVDGNSTFDNQVNKILRWDGTRESLGVGPDVIAGIAIAAGFTAVFLGYRLIRPAIFLAGFAIGSVFCFVVSERVFRDKAYVDAASWVAFVVGGLIVGSLVVWLYKVGIFLVGAFAGLLLATQIHTSFGHSFNPSDPHVALIVLLVVCGLACGAVAVMIERPSLIVATAWAGAVTGVWGIGYFAGNYPNAARLKQHADAKGAWHVDVPVEWWGYLAGSVVLAFVGMFVQFRDQRSRQEQPVAYVIASTPTHGNPIRHV